jgi:formyl-CoA transferase
MTAQPQDNQTALQGLKVVECATVIAAPLAGRLMADFGAEVIHVEHPEKGDHLRQFGYTVDGINPWWKYYARNKKLVTLNIGKPDGRDILFRMLKDADVFIENFRPGRLEAWGIETDTLLEINPRLIIVRLSGFGQTGPYSSQPGFGTLIEAMSGFAEMTGEPGGPPTLPQFALADSFAGFYATAAVMFAIYSRDVIGTGKGQVIDVSLWESMLGMLGPNALIHQVTGNSPTRIGNRTPSSAPRNIYKTKDERWVALSSSTQTTAARLFVVMGQPELIEDPRFDSNMHRVQNVDELDEIVGAWIGAHTREDVTEQLRANDVPIGPVLNIADIMDDAHVQAREMIVETDKDSGKAIQMESVFPKMSATPGSVRHGGKDMGADNDEIFREQLGISKEQLAALSEAGIV